MSATHPTPPFILYVVSPQAQKWLPVTILGKNLPGYEGGLIKRPSSSDTTPGLTPEMRPGVFNLRRIHLIFLSGLTSWGRAFGLLFV